MLKPLLAIALATLTTAAPAAANPREPLTVSLEDWLLPAAIADRITGSGVEQRSVVSAAGGVETANLGSLRLTIGRCVALRGGLGIAAQRRLPFDDWRSGIATSGALSVSLWRHAGFQLDLDLSAMRLRYEDGTTLDGRLVIALRRGR